MDAADIPAARPEDAAKPPYEKPVLRVFGSVAAMTAQLNRDKGSKDGGPNNFKT